MEPKYSDVEEMRDDEFLSKVEEERKIRDRKTYGRDGTFRVWQKTYEYRGIKYNILMMRYYIIDVPLEQMKGMNKYGKWFLLEHPEETKKMAELSYEGEFLYADTLHIYNENQTLVEMFYEMVDRAKRDIDELLDETPNKKRQDIKKIQKDILVLESHRKKYPKVS